MNNCEIIYADLRTNTISTETFHDPYIYNVMGECYFWNGDCWYKGVSYGGTPIRENLKKVFLQHKNDPPK